MEQLKGKKTYLTVGIAFAYIIASGAGFVENNPQIVNAFELIALTFLRSAIGKEP